MTNDLMTITPPMPVNEIIAAHPATVAVFHDWGIDACCGGSLPLGTVAQKHGLDLERLLDELNGVARAADQGQERGT
jgi:iron-sulfur cluster repair protein YtfE (RIC family)